MSARSLSSRCFAAFALFWASQLTAEPTISAYERGWEISLPVYASLMAYRVYDGETTVDFQTFSLSTEVSFTREGSPWTTGVFVDGRLSTADVHDRALSTGVFVEHYASQWDSTAYAFRADRPGASAAWYFGSRVRYRVRGPHKVGLELIGDFDDPAASYLLLGYYLKLTPSLSFRLAGGTNLATGGDYVGRTELVWTLD